jgi:hypothetical protein
MSNFKEKSQVFIIGLMTGLIIAGGFFILKLDNYFKELNFYKNIAKTFYQDSKNKELSVIADDKVPVTEKKSKSNSTKNKTILNIDSTISIKDVIADSVLIKDTLNKALTKALTKDTSEFKKSAILPTSAQSEDIVVMKDELLFSKTIEVINLNVINNNTNSKDSLLQKVSGIKDEKIDTKKIITIELWRSPLNYKGYKMSKNRIALFDIATVEGLKVYILDSVVYLKHGTIVYKLENSSEFRPYERIVEESIISKLK